jgi:hypothetical protein
MHNLLSAFGYKGQMGWLTGKRSLRSVSILGRSTFDRTTHVGIRSGAALKLAEELILTRGDIWDAITELGHQFRSGVLVFLEIQLTAIALAGLFRAPLSWRRTVST